MANLPAHLRICLCIAPVNGAQQQITPRAQARHRGTSSAGTSEADSQEYAEDVDAPSTETATASLSAACHAGDCQKEIRATPEGTQREQAQTL